MDTNSVFLLYTIRKSVPLGCPQLSDYIEVFRVIKIITVAVWNRT